MKTLLLPLLLILSLFSHQKLQAEDNTFKCVTGKYDGSAWYYSSTRLYTAAHLFKKGELQCIIIKNGQKVQCKVLKIDFKADICVLESEPNNTWYTVKSLEVVGIGFVDGQKNENPGVITKFEANSETIPGMSGGPLKEKETDQVYGMIVKNGTFGGTNKCKIIMGYDLINFIKDLP